MSKKCCVLIMGILMLTISCQPPEVSEQIIDSSNKIEYKAGSSDYNRLIQKGNHKYTVSDYKIKSNKHSGRVLCPSGGIMRGSFPLVIIFHAYGKTYKSYLPLQEHLASKGIGSVSIEYLVDEHPNKTISEHLNYIYNNFNFNKNVAILGHSMGGAVAYLHTKYIKDFIGKPVKSLILAAPAHEYSIAGKYEGNAHSTPKNLVNKIENLLVIYGSLDVDTAVWGENPRNTPYFFYDMVGTEYNGANNFPKKDFVFIYGASHKVAGNHNHAKAYITAHLNMNLFNQGRYSKYFKRQQKLLPNYEVDIQHGGKIKKVVANFENNNKTKNTLGGAITYHNGLNQKVSLHDRRTEQEIPNNYFPHYQRYLGIKWSKSTHRVRFHFPNQHKNVKNYDYLSFRVAQNFGGGNIENQSQDFYIRLKDNQGNYKSLRLSNYGVLPYPIEIFKENFQERALVKLNGMKTFIMPLNDFSGVNLRDLDYISFRFSRDGHERGSIAIDNIELIHKEASVILP
ncbi:alpha/beta hydrolase [Aquimarina megaterium]|uniref:alpha/beta hydrolase n=1 Tax=Aquimarina megaterium TaxID=1443666 RepID=UPI0011126DE0|nr:alpha/beta hydrolase [Aquimarina megaterium]